MALTEHDLAVIRAAIEQDAAAVRRADWDAIYSKAPSASRLASR